MMLRLSIKNNLFNFLLGMKINKSEAVSLLVVLMSVIIGLIFYPVLPEKMASHWNSAGEVNGYMSKFWGVFLMPIISMAMYIMLLVVPRIDPKKENIEKFRKYFDNFIILLFIFLLYLYVLTLWWNIGGGFDMVKFLIPAFAALFYYVGVMIGKAQMNFSIGIRTPWTLSSEEVWKKTHVLGAKLFKAAGIISLLGIFFTDIAIWIVMVTVLSAAFIPFVYSYFLYNRLIKK